MSAIPATLAIGEVAATPAACEIAATPAAYEIAATPAVCGTSGIAEAPAVPPFVGASETFPESSEVLGRRYRGGGRGRGVTPPLASWTRWEETSPRSAALLKAIH